jgi:hypothetical protein
MKEGFSFPYRTELRYPLPTFKSTSPETAEG